MRGGGSQLDLHKAGGSSPSILQVRDIFILNNYTIWFFFIQDKEMKEKRQEKFEINQTKRNSKIQK